MSLGTDLLQEWLELRSNTRIQKKFWDKQRHTQQIVEKIKGSAAVGDGDVPYSLLTSKQKREIKRLGREGVHVPALHKKLAEQHFDPSAAAPLAAIDQVLGGQLFGTTDKTLDDQKILGWSADQTAEVAENPTLYHWGTEPMRAALEASTSLPPQSGIVADLYTELPRRGMWLFETPMALRTSSYDPHVAGLLWDLSGKGLWMTTLVRAHQSDRLHRTGTLSTTWSGWCPAGVSLYDLDQWARKLYRQSYAGSSYESSEESQLLGEDSHVAICLQLTKFWLAAVQWMRQRILVRSRPQRILPKNKKRARKMEAQVQGQMPTIEIVQLRRTESFTTEPGSGIERHYTIRFVVHGHFRNQYYSSRGVYAPKWIASYVKGPKDAPLKETIRGFAVTR